MTKIFNFALKIKGGGREGGTCKVLRPCHPPKKKKLKRAPVRAAVSFIIKGSKVVLFHPLTFWEVCTLVPSLLHVLGGSSFFGSD